jgi:hypothetical protein
LKRRLRKTWIPTTFFRALLIKYSRKIMMRIVEMKSVSTRASRKSVVLVVLLALSSILGMTQSIPSVSASSPLVQQNNAGCYFTCASATQEVDLSSPVFSGDVLVVAVALFGGQTPYGTFNVTDSHGTSFTEVTSVCNSVATLICAGIAYGTATSNASSDAITVSFGTPPIQEDVFVYDLSGVMTTGAATGTGQGDYSPISTSSTAFSGEAFLVSVTNLLGTGNFTAGTGFTVSSENSGDQAGYAQYSYSGVTSPTTFPATTSGDDWVEAGLALPLPPASLGPSIVYGNVTWSGVAYQGLQYIFPASVAINGRQFSSTFYESIFAQTQLVPNGNFTGTYTGLFGAISGCQEGSTITITATVGGATESGSGRCPAFGNSMAIDLFFGSTS